MPNDDSTRLRILSDGGIPVHDVLGLIRAIDHAYNGLLATETVLDSMSRWMQRASQLWGLPAPLLASPWSAGLVDPTSMHEPARLVQPSDRLVLSAVELGSPGFWEFAGALNPLEVIRNFLNDRHDRRQDREYKEAAEAERLAWENELLRNHQVLRQRLEILREYGAPTELLIPLLNELVFMPLLALGSLQDRGLITGTGDEPRPPGASRIAKAAKAPAKKAAKKSASSH